MNIYEAFYNQAKDYLGEKDDKEIVAKLRVASDFVAQMEKMGVQPSQPQTPAKQPQNNAQGVSGSTIERARAVGPIAHDNAQRRNSLKLSSNDPLQAGLEITPQRKAK